MLANPQPLYFAGYLNISYSIEMQLLCFGGNITYIK